MAYYLECTSGHLRGKRVTLRPDKAVTFGRDRANTAIIQDRKLSRIHCQVEIINNQIVVTDLNSTNGTYVNGKRIDEETINVGDVIAFGRVRFRLVEADEASREETPPERPRCSECGAEVSEEELSSGAAKRVANRVYCPNCCARVARKERAAEPPTEAEELVESGEDDALPAGTQVGGNKIVKKISEGLYGPVYEAEQVETGRRVLLKLLTAGDEEWARRYLDAVYASGQLIHNNIVLIYDTGEADGRFYISQEYIEGESLSNLLRRHESLPPAEALGIIVQVGHALRHAKEHNITHGSVAPCNIFVAKDNVAKLANFGLSFLRAPDHPPAREDMTVLPYLPPEALTGGEETLDFASDCYSAGAVFFHTLMGRPPFRGSTVEKLQRRILKKAPPSVSQSVEGLPPVADQILSRCLEKLPSARYQQPKEFLYDLEEVLRREL